MSLDSSFFLDAPGATPASIQALLIASGHFERFDDTAKHKRLLAEGCILSIAPPSYPQFALKDAGIDATLHLFFANSDKELIRAWTLNTMHAALKLLHVFPGDALFFYSTGSPALLRRQGYLILDQRCSLWRPEVEILPMVDLPYRWGIITTD